MKMNTRNALWSVAGAGMLGLLAGTAQAGITVTSGPAGSAYYGTLSTTTNVFDLGNDVGADANGPSTVAPTVTAVQIDAVANGTLGSAATIVAPNPNYSELTPPAAWLSIGADTNNQAVQGVSGDDYLFVTNFTSPTNYLNISVSGTMLSDNNVVGAYLDGSSIAFNEPYGQNSAGTFNATATGSTVPTFGPGTSSGTSHTLAFLVHNQFGNTNYNPVGLTFTADVTPAPEPAGFVPFAFVGLALLGLTLRARKANRSANLAC